MATKKKATQDKRLLIFQTYGRQLVGLFQESITKPDPALFLYKHKARTPLFMLESILRLLHAIDNDKGINKTGKIVKKLEDLLGRIDDYDQLYQQFAKYKTIQESQLAYFETKREKAVSKLNRKLQKHNYYQDFFNELMTHVEINFNDEKLILKLAEEVKWQLKSALHFYMQYPSGFKNMESDVHELRRKLRWVSIYGQSLKGIMVIKNVKANYSWEGEFVSEKSRKSAYNKLPVKKGLIAYIPVNHKAFCALNFVIERLGEIKDKGLAMEALQKSIIKTKTKGKHKAGKLVAEELRLSYVEKDLLKEAFSLLHKFFIEFKIPDVILENVNRA